MRIAFIVPDQEVMWNSVHQGIGYVAAYAKANFPINELQVFRTYDKDDSQLELFLKKSWDVIGITLTTPMVLEAEGLCKKIQNFSAAKIVLGGAEVSAVEDNILEQLPLADFAVIGEGEVTFLELLECLAGKREFSSVDGLVYRDADGAICKNSKRQFEKNLSIFPPPDRSLFQYDYKFHSIIGTRGCPYHCTFCNSSANWGHRYRVRPPEDIFNEVKNIIALYGRDKYIAFDDDAFNINKKWVVEVCGLLEKLKVRLWIRGIRAGLVTKEVAKALKDAGCFGVACGVESADNDALKSMRKATTIEEILRGVEIIKSSGIRNVTGQFIIGNQGDTLATVKKSIEHAKYFTQPTFGIAYPIPNTFLYDYISENGYFLPEKVPIMHKGKIIDWVLFDTPHFTLQERLEAVQLAIDAKVYHGIDYLLS